MQPRSNADPTILRCQLLPPFPPNNGAPMWRRRASSSAGWEGGGGGAYFGCPLLRGARGTVNMCHGILLTLLTPRCALRCRRVLSVPNLRVLLLLPACPPPNMHTTTTLPLASSVSHHSAPPSLATAAYVIALALEGLIIFFRRLHPRKSLPRRLSCALPPFRPGFAPGKNVDVATACLLRSSWPPIVLPSDV